MQATLVKNGVAEALAAALAGVWTGPGGAPAEVGPAKPTADAGWLVNATADGGVDGPMLFWLERAGAAAATRAALGLEADPKDEAVTDWLRDVVARAIAAWSREAGHPDLNVGAPTIVPGAAPVDAVHFELTAGAAACHVAVHAAVTIGAPAVAATRRIEAVLDVDLPLVVRFGRTTMALRALAGLGPGSVIDMGRSPDEPVELLVGERVIARGEVVIVAGNYGVRITELTGGARAGADLEARA